MPSRPLRHTAPTLRDRAFWAAATALVLGQLLAFWMLCAHQVRKAEVRHASTQVEQLAVADCLRYLPNATLTSCAARIAPAARDAQAVVAASPATTTAVPVNYVYH
ncbi:hypothetical protein [Ramlibacter sp.]|uniref:hypothetical protein n=1 Tax=Ramlibacter sp. TaxID=1917967 RepID=UPI002C28981F|nr:hypothetical protein [Ramlibacter sp.]HWI80808.1 hypothetical protein [Ramlibacter sp.]